MILKGFKYRLYPTEAQQVLIAKHLGCARWLYNWGLNKKVEAYQKENKSLSCIELINELPNLKAAEETSWLKEVNSQVLQMSLRNLDNAFTRFFRKKKGFPNFKSKHQKRQSFQVPQHSMVDFEAGTISIGKLPDIKARLHRKFEGKVKTVTITKTSSGKYFASVLVETVDVLPEKKPIASNTTLGIDVGLSHFAIFSNGEKIENPKFLKKSIERLAFLQKRLSRKVKGSANRNKARIRVAKLHERITNQRNNFLHKLTSNLVRDNQTDSFCLESLAVANMVKNHTLAQAISDVSWSRFTEFLTYKADCSGKNVVRIGRFEPSSKMCSTCGHIEKEMPLQVRTWNCPSCGAEHDRDVNAAINIKKFALRNQNLLRLEEPELRLGSIGGRALR